MDSAFNTAPVGSTLDTCSRQFTEALGCFLTCSARRRHGQWYVLASFARHDTPYAVVPSLTTVAWLDLLVLTYLALFLHFRCVPLIVGRPLDFFCGDSQVQFLDKVLVCLGVAVQTVHTV